jgi:hypothetical protein
MLKYLIVTAIAATLAGSARADRDFEFSKTDDFDGAAISAIKIEMDYGEISLIKSSTSKIQVDYKNIVYTANKSEADKLDSECKYTAEVSGKRLIIKVERPERSRHDKNIISRIVNGDWNDDINPMLRVSIPDNKSIQINSASADIEAAEVSCDLRIESASSDISLENTSGDVECDLSSGDIDVTGHRGQVSLKGNSSDLQITDIVGNLDARTSSGDVNLDKIKGNVQLSTTSGDCRIYDIDGDLDLSSTSGDLVADGISGSVHAEAVSGDIKLSALSAAEGNFDVESVSGDIQMEVSRNFQGEVSLRSISGDVDSRLSGKTTYVDDFNSSSHSQIRGRVGEGKGRLNVASTSGDININGY